MLYEQFQNSDVDAWILSCAHQGGAARSIVRIDIGTSRKQQTCHAIRIALCD